jgi:hypothetical protein
MTVIGGTKENVKKDQVASSVSSIYVPQARFLLGLLRPSGYYIQPPLIFGRLNNHQSIGRRNLNHSWGTRVLQSHRQNPRTLLGRGFTIAHYCSRCRTRSSWSYSDPIVDRLVKHITSTRENIKQRQSDTCRLLLHSLWLLILTRPHLISVTFFLLVIADGWTQVDQTLTGVLASPAGPAQYPNSHMVNDKPS